jgi:hypothetical protein
LENKIAQIFAQKKKKGTFGKLERNLTNFQTNMKMEDFQKQLEKKLLMKKSRKWELEN